MACCRHRWTVLAILLLIAGSAVAAEDTEGPVPLYTPRPRTPIEAAGADVVPELKVRVEIDARGRVTEVVVLGIQPSTSLDEHFKREAIDTLMRWRYYPASSDGQPASTRLEWKLKFPSLDAVQEEEVSLQGIAPSWHLLDRGEDSSDRYRRFVLSLPVTDRLDMLKGFVSIAEGFLTSDSIKEYATGRVIALTDAPSDDVARILAANIESLFNILEEMLKAKVEAQPEPNKIVAVIYASEPSYKRLVRSVRANENWAGFYNPAGLLVFHMNQPSNETLTGLLLHEATHAYIDRYVVRPGVSPPRWLNEGFAEYIGNSTIRKKQLVPGKKRTTEVYRNSWFVQTGRSHTLVTAKTVRDAIRSGEAMTLEEIITAGPQEFYGERMSTFYAMSWLLVHFLRHGEAGWAENEFPSLMLYVAEGYPAQEALRQFYGELEDLEPRFHDYVKGF